MLISRYILFIIFLFVYKKTLIKKTFHSFPSNFIFISLYFIFIFFHFSFNFDLYFFFHIIFISFHFILISIYFILVILLFPSDMIIENNNYIFYFNSGIQFH